MSEGFAAAAGRKVISRSSAEELGQVTHLIVDVGRRQVTGVVVGKGRRARLVDWDRVTGFGPDAVVVDEEGALRPPAGDREEDAVHGRLDMVGKRALTDAGDDEGPIEDVIFDPATGELITIVVGGRESPAADLLGAGSYAVVLGAASEPAPAPAPATAPDQSGG